MTLGGMTIAEDALQSDMEFKDCESGRQMNTYIKEHTVIYNYAVKLYFRVKIVNSD
jgi:hypothetical protein